jgi:hypothetical protein
LSTLATTHDRTAQHEEKININNKLTWPRQAACDLLVAVAVLIVHLVNLVSAHETELEK